MSPCCLQNFADLVPLQLDAATNKKVTADSPGLSGPSGPSHSCDGCYASGQRALRGTSLPGAMRSRVIDTGHVRPALRLLSMKGLRFNGGKRWQTACEQSVNYPNSQPAECSR